MKRTRNLNSLKSLVVDAVSSEPISGLNSLVTGRFTGNSHLRKPSCADQTARKCLANRSLLSIRKLPRCKIEQGIFEQVSGNYLGVIREYSACSREPAGWLALRHRPLLEGRLEQRHDLKQHVARVDHPPDCHRLLPAGEAQERFVHRVRMMGQGNKILTLRTVRAGEPSSRSAA